MHDKRAFNEIIVEISQVVQSHMITMDTVTENENRINNTESLGRVTLASGSPRRSNKTNRNCSVLGVEHDGNEDDTTNN